MEWNPVIVISPKTNSLECAFNYAKEKGYYPVYTFIVHDREVAKRISKRYGWKNILEIEKETRGQEIIRKNSRKKAE